MLQKYKIFRFGLFRVMNLLILILTADFYARLRNQVYLNYLINRKIRIFLIYLPLHLPVKRDRFFRKGNIRNLFAGL